MRTCSFFALLLIAFTSQAHDEQTGLATYMGNEAVMVHHGDRKIVFDPFFHNSFEIYQLVPDDILTALFANEAPYNDIDAIFISHAHGDHFAADQVLKYLKQFPKTQLFAPKQAVDQLMALPSSQSVSKQINAIELKYGDPAQSLNVAGLQIDVVRIPHAGWPTRRLDVSNLLFRVTLAKGTTVMHMGDADPNDVHFKPYDDLWQAKVTNTAFPPYWFFNNTHGPDILNHRINALESVGVHVPKQVPEALKQTGKPYFSKPGETRNVGQHKQSNGQIVIDTLLPALCDKEVVLLGELPSHGEAITFQIKAQLVQDLVSQCGFDFVFFEAPVYEFWGLQEALDNKTATSRHIENALGGFWVNKELDSWRDWLLTQAQSGDLILRGLDDQVSRSAEHSRKQLIELIKLNTASIPDCVADIERNLYWRYDESHPYDQNIPQQLLKCTHHAMQTLKSNQHKQQPPLDWQFLSNLANLYARQSNQTKALDRDAMMFNNWHWQNQSTPSKSIIWTATVHAAKKQGPLKHKPLGQWLDSKLGNQVASVGFTTYSGESLMAGTVANTFDPAPQGSLEFWATKEFDQPFHHLNPNQLAQMGTRPARLFGSFHATDWYTFFDHVIVIRKETAPTFD